MLFWSLFGSFLLLLQHAVASCTTSHSFIFCPFLYRVTNDSTLNNNYAFYVDVNLHMQYILVMSNKRLINKWILLWYVDVLVSVSPFRKISRAAQVTNLNPHLFFHISAVTYMYSRGHMGMTRCIFQGPGNFKTFHHLHD